MTHSVDTGCCLGCLGPLHGISSQGSSALAPKASEKAVGNPIRTDYSSGNLSDRATGSGNDLSVHIIVANALGIGHYTPMANLVQLLLTRPLCYLKNLRITFIAPTRSHEVKGSSPPASHPNLHFVQCVLDGPDVHPVNMNAMISRCAELQQRLTDSINYTSNVMGWPKPTAVIHDLFAVFAQRFADEVLNVPRILFNPSHAMTMALLILFKFRQALWSDSGVVDIPDFARPARMKLLWNMFQSRDDEPVFSSCDIMGICGRAAAIISNDLPSVFPNLSKEIKKTSEVIQSAIVLRDSVPVCPQRCIFAAPLCSLQPPQPPKEHDAIMRWMDNQPPRSVIYVALGTLYDISPEALKAMAAALEICHRPFLWAYRLDPKGVVTEEYKDRVSNRAMIAGWVDQRAVLQHPALRVFVSHGGWNSCMEALTLAGVPMICVPLGSEQAINAMIMSDGIGMAEVALVEEEKRAKLTEEERSGLAMSSTPGNFAHMPEGLQNFWWRSCNCEEWLRLLRRVCDTDYEELYRGAQEAHIKTLRACAPQGQLMMSADELISLVSDLS